MFFGVTQYYVKQECAAVEGLPAMGPSLQLTACVLPHGDIKCCHLVNHLDPVNCLRWESSVPLALVLYPTLLGPIIRLTLTQLPCPVTLTFDFLTSKLVHGVLVSRESFLPSLVFVGLFVFSLGVGTGRTDGQTDRQHRYIMGPPSRKDGPIITEEFICITPYW